MAAIPPFLNALDLDTSADERAIRRAYAKRLKRIDQETDPAAFQALRESFEAALKWAAWQARQNVAMPAMAPVERPAVPAAPPAPVPPPPPPPRPTGPPTLRVVRDAASATPYAVAASIPDAVSTPTPPATPRSRPPGATPLPADTPTLSLLQDAKRTLARPPAPARASADAPTPVPVRAPVSAPAVATPAVRPPASPSDAPQPAAAAPQATLRRPAAPALAVVPDQEAADLVFADFVQRFNRVADSEAVVGVELAAALADPRLVNLDARTAFEAHVAVMIMGGWKPGHEFLFKPACDTFEWESDRRRLEIHGPMGTVLDAAIRERLIFSGQMPLVLDPQRKLMRRLRTDKPLRPAEIAPNIQMLSMLLQRYPNWMRVMTRQDVVQHWIDTWNGFTPEQRQAAAPNRAPTTTPATRIPPPAKPFQPKRSSSGFGGFGGMVWVIVMVIGAIARMAGSSNSGTPAYHYQAPPAVPMHATVPQIPSYPNLGSQSPADFPSPYVGGTPAQGGSVDPSTQPLSPADEVRRQLAADRLERRQQQIDAMNAKRALRNGQGSTRYDEQLVPVPDPNVIPGQANPP